METEVHLIVNNVLAIHASVNATSLRGIVKCKLKLLTSQNDSEMSMLISWCPDLLSYMLSVFAYRSCLDERKKHIERNQILSIHHCKRLL